MKAKILVLAMSATLFASCNSNKSNNESDKQITPATNSIKAATDIPYIVAQHYFIKNTVENKLLTLKITSKDEFNKYFGMAATMGKNGTPTIIDFSHQYVLAVAGSNTDKETTISPVSLVQKDGAITFSYKWEEGKKQSFDIRPVLLIVVENSYKEDVKFEKL